MSIPPEPIQEIDIAQLEMELRAIHPILICSEHDEDRCTYLCSEAIAASGLTIPKWANCALSGEIMKKPVMDDLGISYESTVYAEHGGLGGQMKPYSKMEGSFEAYPNLNLEQAIRDFWDRCCEIVFGNKITTTNYILEFKPIRGPDAFSVSEHIRVSAKK